MSLTGFVYFHAKKCWRFYLVQHLPISTCGDKPFKHDKRHKTEYPPIDNIYVLQPILKIKRKARPIQKTSLIGRWSTWWWPSSGGKGQDCRWAGWRFRCLDPRRHWQWACCMQLEPTSRGWSGIRSNVTYKTFKITLEWIFVQHCSSLPSVVWNRAG